jgi:hypothetical protein
MFKGLNLKILFTTFIFALLLASPISSPSARVIETSKNKASFAVFSLNDSLQALSRSKVRMIYKGKVNRLNNINIYLIDWGDSSNNKAHFYRTLLGKSLSQISGYRASLAFAGKGNIPSTIKNNDIDSILEWLTSNPNGIAYAPINTLPSNANILFVLVQGE